MAITLDGTNGITTPAVTNNGAYTGDGISFADATPSNTLVTTTGGNVGIGTSSPNSFLFGKLVVGTTSGSNHITIASGTTGEGTLAFADGTSGNDAYRGYIQYPHTNDAMIFGTGGTERMRIDSSGNLLVGRNDLYASEKISVYNAGSSGFVMALRNDYSGTKSFIQFHSGPNPIGSITGSGSTTAYNTSSDYRLKENIAPMTGALGVVQQLKPVTYTWKVDGSDGQGFIAHELAEIVPDAVCGEKDAVELVDIKDEEGNVIGQEERPIYQGIDTSFLVATLTAAIQELKAELDTVKTELATLKGTA